MSVYGQWKTVTIALGGKKSAEVDLGRDYDYLELEIPALDSCTMNLEVSRKTGGTFQNLGSTTEAVGLGALMDVWFLGGFQFIMLECSANQDGGERIFYVRGMRY